jgi:hypothetical protein
VVIIGSTPEENHRGAPKIQEQSSPNHMACFRSESKPLKLRNCRRIGFGGNWLWAGVRDNESNSMKAKHLFFSLFAALVLLFLPALSFADGGNSGGGSQGSGSGGGYNQGGDWYGGYGGGWWWPGYAGGWWGGGYYPYWGWRGGYWGGWRGGYWRGWRGGYWRGWRGGYARGWRGGRWH